MASTYSSILGIELMGTGENSGTWGTKTNNNLSPLYESAVAGRATANFATDANTTIAITDGTDSTGRYLILNCTSSGSLTATRNLVCPLRAGKTYLVFNNTTGGQSIQVIAASGTGVTIPNGKKAFVYCDGTNYIMAIDYLPLPLPTRQVLTSGSGATYTTPAGCRQIVVTMIGGGGGGGGATANGGVVTGSTGGNTLFDGSNFSAVGGNGGNTAGGAGGSGGSGGTSPTTIRYRGNAGQAGLELNGTGAPANPPGGTGGAGHFGGNGIGSPTSGVGAFGLANTGAGGSGGVSGAGPTNFQSGGGGGAGEYVQTIITTPSATYTYTIGAGGAGGVSTQNGGAGGSGVIFVEEQY